MIVLNVNKTKANVIWNSGCMDDSYSGTVSLTHVCLDSDDISPLYPELLWPGL